MKEECERRGFTYLESSSSNRASRLNEGIKKAQGDWLVFHHPRSILEAGALEQVKKLREPTWGAFTHQFDQKHSLLNFTSFWSNKIRGDFSKIYYLDHCLFAHKDILKQVDTPFGEDDIFEDTVFCEKLNQIEKPLRLKYRSNTSSIRFQENGIYIQAIMNQFLKIAYKTKLNRKIMNKIYERGLNLNQNYKSDKF